jgi:two-component system, NarL family, invasion response regulator UvrY
MPMKILVCDDHPMFCDGIKNALSILNDLECFDRANNCSKAMEMLRSKPYDIVIMDISLPDKSGLDCLEVIKKIYPDVKVLMLSMHSEEAYGMRCLKKGADAYLNKDSDPEEMRLAIRTLANNKKYISTKLASIMAEKMNREELENLHDTLNDREFEIMLGLAVHKSYDEIARYLNISENVISTYRYRMMRKMKFKNTFETTQYCIEHKLIKL